MKLYVNVAKVNIMILHQPVLTITTLNVNGIRAASRKGIELWLEKSTPDFLCVQELKAQQEDLRGKLDTLAQMQGYFYSAQKKGYSGVGVYTKWQPSEVITGFDQGEFDQEGRYLELRFDTPKEKFSIISCYFPSGTSGDHRQEAKYRFLDLIFTHLQKLSIERHFVLCGDVNIAHTQKDLKNWKANQKNSGFLPEERTWMTKLLASGIVDVYRHLEPETTDSSYTWWSQRGAAYTNNVGWRLDYQLATPTIAKRAQRQHIYKAEKFSDHAPLTIWYSRTQKNPT